MQALRVRIVGVVMPDLALMLFVSDRRRWVF
jgi:hypothetical protein